jgi:SAM-dependent methyltransferase
MPADVFDYNREAWNSQVRKGNQWTVPVDEDVVAAARKGDWQIVLTPEKAIPRNWFPNQLEGCQILCLASGGGQQGPILAAAGADVTVFDLSPDQLERDRQVADREDLDLKTVEGNMQDLSIFADETFDLIVHPCSNTFVPDVNPVWREAYRVLKAGGRMMAGMINPLLFLFDEADLEQGRFEVKYKQPYSDLETADEATLQRYKDEQEPLVFGHSLTDQIGGQLRAGFKLIDFYEDTWPDYPISKFTDSMFATLVEK